MKNIKRYGTVIIKGEKVIQFKEKKKRTYGNINGGIYVVQTQVFEKLNLGDTFSFEKDFLEKYIDSLNFNAYISDSYFIDIGIPEDYVKAQNELPQQI